MAPNKFIIERQVAEFRADNGLSASEAINLKSLLLKLNVLTIFRPLSDNFSGMCLKDGSGHRFMLVNSSHSRGRQHFTIAHELYHLYIESKPTPHKCNPCSGSKDPVEQSADMFASSLLMPETGLCQLIRVWFLNKDTRMNPNLEYAQMMPGHNNDKVHAFAS